MVEEHDRRGSEEAGIANVRLRGAQKLMAWDRGDDSGESVSVGGEALMTTVNLRWASRSDCSTYSGVAPRARRNPR